MKEDKANVSQLGQLTVLLEWIQLARMNQKSAARLVASQKTWLKQPTPTQPPNTSYIGRSRRRQREARDEANQGFDKQERDLTAQACL
jgi:hypothetical protein